MKKWNPLLRVASRSYANSFEWGLQHFHPGSPQLGHFKTPISHAKGSYIFLEDGRKILDFATGIGVANTGHSHPRVVKAAQEQLEKFIHCQLYMGPSRTMINLQERLLSIMPDPSLNCFFFSNSGSEGIENAIKMAKVATGRTDLITVEGSFHGRTYATASMTNSKEIYRRGANPGMGGVHVIPFTYCAHCNQKPAGSGCCLNSIKQLEYLFKTRVTPKNVAAIVIEPVLGEGGYVLATKEYFQALRKICDREGILLIVDEIQSGFGRTGKWFGIENFDVRPDILVAAKGIASGLPLSVVASNRSVMETQPAGSVGGTFNGNIVAMAASVATIDVIREENLLQNSLDRGVQVRDGLSSLKQDLASKVNIDVRGLGSMNGIEFVGAPAGTVSKITTECGKKDLLLLSTSCFETIRFIPPLTTTPQEVDTALNIFTSVVKDLFKN